MMRFVDENNDYLYLFCVFFYLGRFHKHCTIVIRNEKMLKEFFRYICWVKLLSFFDFFCYFDKDIIFYDDALNELLFDISESLLSDEKTIESYLFWFFHTFLYYYLWKEKLLFKYYPYPKESDSSLLYFFKYNFDLWPYIILFFLYLNLGYIWAGLLLSFLIGGRFIGYYFRMFYSLFQSYFLEFFLKRVFFILSFPLRLFFNLSVIGFVFYLLSVLVPGSQFLSLLVVRYIYMWLRPYYKELKEVLFS